MIFCQLPNFDNNQQQSVNQESNDIIEQKCTISLKKSVPNSNLGPYHHRRYIKKNEIAVLAEKKYRENGLAITFKDVIKELRVSKRRAQRILKYCHRKKILFTAQDLAMEGIKIKGIRRESPQQYYLTDFKSQFIEHRKNNVLKDTTGTYLSKIDLLKAQSFQDILSALRYYPLYIHNMQLETFVPMECYEEIEITPQPGNKAKILKERIGTSQGSPNVKYLLYPSGKVTIHIVNSARPFRLVTEEDILHILTFLGRVEDRLHCIFSDARDMMVFPVKNWVLKGCDVNKDVDVDSLAQLSLPNIQIPLGEKALRGYVKLVDDKAFYRIEVTLSPNEKLHSALNKARTEIKIDENVMSYLW